MTTSSPGPTPAAKAAACSAAVPDDTATPCRDSTRAATAPSNAATAGPVVSQSPRSVLTTAATSSSSISWRPYDRTVARTGAPPYRASVSPIDQQSHARATGRRSRRLRAGNDDEKVSGRDGDDGVERREA